MHSLSNIAKHVIGFASEGKKTVQSRFVKPTKQDWENHFKGTAALGIVPCSGNGYSNWWVLDCDSPGASIEDAKKAFAPLLDSYSSAHIEPGLTRGWRLYVFFNEEVSFSTWKVFQDYAQVRLKVTLESFPKGERTITVPGYGIPDFSEKLTHMVDDAWSASEVFALMQAFPYSGKFHPVPITSYTDNTTYSVVINSCITKNELLKDAMESFNNMFIVPGHSPTDLERVVESALRSNKRSDILETLSKNTRDDEDGLERVGGFEYFKECIESVRQVKGEQSRFEFTLRDPMTNGRHHLQVAAGKLIYKSVFQAYVWSKTGYKYRFPDDKEIYEEWTDSWFHCEAVEESFAFTKAGMLFRNLLDWVFKTPIRTEAEALKATLTSQFLKGDKLYISYDIIPSFVGNAAAYPFGMKLEDCDYLTKELIRQGVVEKVNYAMKEWLTIKIEEHGLMVVQAEQGGQPFVIQKED